jgi:hypothetical protein
MFIRHSVLKWNWVSLLVGFTEERCAMADRWLVVGGQSSVAGGDPLLFWGQAKVKINVSGSVRGGRSYS